MILHINNSEYDYHTLVKVAEMAGLAGIVSFPDTENTQALIKDTKRVCVIQKTISGSTKLPLTLRRASTGCSEDFQVLAITTMVSSFVAEWYGEVRSGIMNEG